MAGKQLQWVDSVFSLLLVNPTGIKKAHHLLCDSYKIKKYKFTFATGLSLEYNNNIGPLQFRHGMVVFSCVLRSCQQYLFTKSCSFCMGSGSPSLPQVRISLPSYTLMIRSAVFMRKQLYNK